MIYDTWPPKPEIFLIWPFTEKKVLTSSLSCYENGLSENKAHPVTSRFKNIRWFLRAYTVESRVFYDTTSCLTLLCQFLCTLLNNLATLDFLVLSHHAKILSHFRVLPHLVLVSTMSFSLFFIGWATTSHVSLMFENSTIHSTKRHGERAILLKKCMFLNEHEAGAWTYCFLGLLRSPLPLIW